MKYIGREIGPYKIIGKQINQITQEIEYVCQVGNYQMNFTKKKMKQLEKTYATRD